MKNKSLLLVLILSGTMIFATSFNYSSALINAPSAEVLNSLGYWLVINHAHSFSSDIFDAREVGEEDMNFNFAYHIPMNEGIFKLNLEVGLTVYSMFSVLQDQNALAGNIKLQVIQDPTDKDYKANFDFDKNPVYKYLPSVAIGLKNISGDKYLTSIGTIPPYLDENGDEVTYGAEEYNLDNSFNNSFYIAFTKKFYLGDFFLKGHLGWGMGTFMGVKKADRNAGLVWGVSTTIFPINKLSPLSIMFDFDGNKYSIGAQLIYTNPQLLDLAKDEGMKKFIPGFVVNLAVTDIDEAFRTYGENGWSPKIEFGLGITNNAYLSYGSDKALVAKKTVKKPTPKKEVTPKKEKGKEGEKKMTPEEIRELAKQKALEARKKAEEQKAKEEALKAQPEIKKEDVEKKFSDTIKATMDFFFEEKFVRFIPKTIKFKTASDEIMSVAFPALDEIAKYLKENPTVKTDIEGHTDNIGERSFNVDLATKRAESVKKYLIGKGVKAEQLTAIGYGPDKPRYDNATPIGKAKNRRVEFRLHY